MTSGVYAITNTVTGRTYIGFGLDVLVRMTAHVRSLGLGKHFSRTLQEDWDRYGANAFTLDLVEEAPADLDEQVRAEERWIALAMAREGGAYNRHRSCKSRSAYVRTYQRWRERNSVPLERLEQILIEEHTPKPEPKRRYRRRASRPSAPEAAGEEGTG